MDFRITSLMLADKYERARRLKKAIFDRGYSTFREAAARHHYSEPTLTSHANGTRGFDLETGYAYAKAFKVDPVWLLGLRDEAKEQVTVSAEAIREMMSSAMRELPLGATVEDYLRVVPEGLRVRLEQYLAGGASQDTLGEEIAPGKGAPPLAPTSSNARG